MELFAVVLVSFLSYEKNQLRAAKVYFGFQFQRFQSMSLVLLWACGMAEHTIMVGLVEEQNCMLHCGQETERESLLL